MLSAFSPRWPAVHSEVGRGGGEDLVRVVDTVAPANILVNGGRLSLCQTYDSLESRSSGGVGAAEMVWKPPSDPSLYGALTAY